MTNSEIAANLKEICLNKIEYNKNIQNNDKVKALETISKILDVPNSISKEHIETTINILNDLEIDDETTFMIIDEIMKQSKTEEDDDF